MDSKVLTVNHFDENPEFDARVTVSPYSIKAIFAREIERRERKLSLVTILFIDSDEMQICISGLELFKMEQAVGIIPDDY